MNLIKEVESRTLKSILYARKTEGLYSCIVTGKRGIGKSSYSLQILFNIFKKLGFDTDTAWQMALDRIKYTVKEVVTFLKTNIDNDTKDIFIWDDAGVYAGGVRWRTDYKEMVLIESICDTFRDCVYCVLFTVPEQRTLTRRIRSYDDFLVKIQYLKKDELKNYDDDTNNLRVARLYKKVILPSSQVRVYKQYYDTFDIMLPGWVYDQYKKKRRKYTKTNIEKLMSSLES